MHSALTKGLPVESANIGGAYLGVPRNTNLQLKVQHRKTLLLCTFGVPQ